MTDSISDLLARRRDQAIAIVLRVKEDECDEFLSATAQQALRKVVLDQINDLHNVAADLLRSLERDDVAINEHYLAKIDEIHEVLTGAAPVHH